MAKIELKVHKRRYALGILAAAMLVSACGTSALALPTQTTSKPGTLINSPDDPVNQWVAQTDPQQITNQETLVKLREWIRSQPGDPSGKYLDQVDDISTDSTKFLWAGDPNDPFIQSAMQEAKTLGIDASIETRPYSLSELAAAQNAIEALRQTVKALGFDLRAISGVRADTSDLYVTGTLSAGADVDSITAALQAVTQIPLHLVNQQAGETTRQADTSPFYAGAFMTDSYGSYCSSGFSMIYAGGTHITTARHCIPEDNTSGAGWYSANGSGRQGQIIYTANTGALSVLKGTGAAIAYDGAWNNSSGYAKSVYNYSTPGIGDNVCTGGGNSGEHCGANIKETGVILTEDSGQTVSTVRAQVSSGIAVIEGDSGGPVVIPITSGSGSGEVHAVGMIQGEVGGHTNCGSVAISTGALCSDQVLFSYISTVVNHSSLVLATQ